MQGASRSHQKPRASRIIHMSLLSYTGCVSLNSFFLLGVKAMPLSTKGTLAL